MLFVRTKLVGLIPFYVFGYCFRTLAVFLFIQICLIPQKPKEIQLDKSPAYNGEGHMCQQRPDMPMIISSTMQVPAK